MFQFNFKFVVLFVCFFTLSSCGKEKKPTSADLKIDLKTYVGNEEAQENLLKYPTVAGHTFSVQNLAYYLTRISLVADDGGVIELKKAHYFDNQIEGTNDLMITNVTSGHYKAMTFTFGFKHEDNFTTFLPNTTDNQNMEWPEQLGPGAFHYMKFEGQYDVNNSGTIKGFNYHIGPSKGADFSFDVSQNIDMTIDGETMHLTIMMDLFQWFHEPNEYDFEAWQLGIMSNPAGQSMAQENGANVFSVVWD